MTAQLQGYLKATRSPIDPPFRPGSRIPMKAPRMVKSQRLQEDSFICLSERMEGVLELLLQDNEIVAVTTTCAPHTYYGVIFYRAK